MTPGRRRRPAAPPGPAHPLRDVAWVIACIDAGSGTSFLLGAPADAPALRLLTEIAPIPILAATLIAAGLLAVARLHVAACMAGVLAWAGYAVSCWAATASTPLSGASGPWVATGLAVLHFVTLRNWANPQATR